MGGGPVPRSTERGQNLKKTKIFKKIPTCRFTGISPYEKIVRSENWFRSPIHVCKKAKGLEIYFSCNHCIMLAYFCLFHDRNKLSRTIFFSWRFLNIWWSTSNIYYSKGIYVGNLFLWLSPSFVMLHIEKINLEPYYMPKYDLVT